jgi:hypothetical protein
VTDDGLYFDPDTLKAEAITEDADYHGLRVTFTGFLDNARIPMQLDIGFGDPVFPFPSWLEFPALLDFPAARFSATRPNRPLPRSYRRW